MTLTFLDFFSGVGGFRHGLELAGMKCVGFCEKDKFARKSYEAMYDTKGEWFHDDIHGILRSAKKYKECLMCLFTGNHHNLVF